MSCCRSPMMSQWPEALKLAIMPRTARPSRITLQKLHCRQKSPQMCCLLASLQRSNGKQGLSGFEPQH